MSKMAKTRSSIEQDLRKEIFRLNQEIDSRDGDIRQLNEEITALNYQLDDAQVKISNLCDRLNRERG